MREVSCGFWQPPELDLEAELGDLGSEAFGFDVDRAAIKVVGTEVLVFGAILQHVVDRGEQRSRHGAHRFLRAVPAAQAVELRLVIAVLLARRGETALDQQRLEPGRAFAQAG